MQRQCIVLILKQHQAVLGNIKRRLTVLLRRNLDIDRLVVKQAFVEHLCQDSSGHKVELLFADLSVLNSSQQLIPPLAVRLARSFEIETGQR
ncbi:hypothetical protein D3C73_1208960 [compost metagenome]